MYTKFLPENSQRRDRLEDQARLIDYIKINLRNMVEECSGGSCKHSNKQKIRGEYLDYPDDNFFLSQKEVYSLELFWIGPGADFSELSNKLFGLHKGRVIS
jgi:hypothetical protein